MGTSALTGKDSGCSGMLQKGHSAQMYETREQNLLRHLPDKTHAIFIGFAETKNSSRANADTSITNSAYGAQSVVIRSRCNNLQQIASLSETYVSHNKQYLWIEFSRSVQVMIICCQSPVKQR